MRVFVAGASGAIGRPLIERLTRKGYDVTGMVRSAVKARQLEQAGSRVVEADALDKHAVRKALQKVRPDVVIDELTHLPANPADLNKALPADRQLRFEGGGNLFAAAEELGVRRYIQQSCGFYLDSQGRLAGETAPMRVDAPGGIHISAAMYAELEQRVLGLSRTRGTALRYGFLYGPGTWYWAEGAVAEQLRRGEASIIGGGTAVWSFVHVEDAADATIAALNAEPGVFNVVDDDPLPVREWLPAFARWVNAPEPASMSAESALSQVGPDGVYLHTQLSGASNVKAKTSLGFSPRALMWKDC